MTKNKTYLRLHCLFYAVLVAMSAVGVCGCSDDDGEAPAVIAKDVVVSFRVVTESQPQTRAVTPTPSDVVWGGEYDDKDKGDDFDNTLLVEGFSVFVTNEDCTKRYAEVKSLLCTKSEETTGEVTTVVYNFVGEISAADAQNLISNKTGKLHVVANMPDFTLPATGMGNDHTFTLSGQPSDNFKAIPMWGVMTVDKFANMANLGPNDQFYAGEVWLLRSMAKVEIEIDNEADTNVITELVEATVTGANGQGYLLPVLPESGWTSITETKSIKVGETLREYRTETKASGIYTPSDNKKIIFYLPESQNTDGEEGIKIDLKFKVGDKSEEGTIYFAEYKEGAIPGVNPTYYNIVRNHLYRFSVRRQSQDTDLEIKWTVCPMKELQSNIPDFE